MKIASCVLTYNGADIIDDVLANCAEYYYEEGIDIYYFDASVDDSTKQIIDKYRANGYTNLYHLHMPDASSLDRTTKMMSGELFNKKYDYIWPSKNRSYLSKEGIRDILQVIRMKPDVVVCMPDDNDQTAIIQYTDPVQLYHDTAWIMTSLDTVLYKKDTIFDNYKTQEYYVGFNEFYSYVLNKMPCMKELNAIVVCGRNMTFVNSELGKSHYNVFDVWKNHWINVNQQLPDCYDLYKNDTIKQVAQLPWLIGDIDRVYEFYRENLIREDNIEEVKNNWKMISDVPVEVLDKMVKGRFDLYHDTMYIKDEREIFVLLGRIIEMIKERQIQISQIPMDAIHNVMLSGIEEKIKINSDLRFVKGTINDIYQQMIRDDITMEECCMYLQMYISLGILL